MTYAVREELKPSNLNGISDDQINDHWNLYVGYVNQTNALKKELAELREAGKGDALTYADRRRRFGFEMNGMVLHEYYFGNLSTDSNQTDAGAFVDAVTKQWGSFEAWAADFSATGKSRSIGWAICAMDPVTGDINNHFIQLHEEGNIAAFHPIVVMDVWEHAYMVDHKAGGRAAYIEKFMSNINWRVVAQRFAAAQAGGASVRFAQAA